MSISKGSRRSGRPQGRRADSRPPRPGRAEPRVRRGRRGAAGRGEPGADPDQGSRSRDGERLSELVDGPSGRGAVRAEPRRGDRTGAARGDRRRFRPNWSSQSRLQHELISSTFRVYASDDLVGVELSAAAKNVIALAAGGVDGLGLGDNAKAGLISRGLREMARLGRGVRRPAGDVLGPRGHGRPGGHLLEPPQPEPTRRRAARPRTHAEQAAAEIGMVVEGLTTAPVLSALAKRAAIELPITDAVHR